MTDTRCSETTAVDIGFAHIQIVRCTRDAGHGPGHWLVDDRDEIEWHWESGQAPRRVVR